MKNLLDIKIGQYVKLKSYKMDTPIKIKRRLLDLGFTEGQKLRTIRKSLLGKTYMLELRGFTLTLRKDILSFILVE